MSDPIGAHAVPDDETGPSDLDLVERTRAGDSRAFAELWNRHSRAGRTVARSFSYDADDIVSESFAKVLQAIRNGGGPTSAFRPYLFSTIRNVAMQLKRGAQIDTSDELDALADPTSEEAETLLALDKSLTAQAFRSLPTRWQEALWYSEVEQLASHEIAPLLGMTSNAVSALTFRAREGLRQAWIGAHLARAADTECAAVIEKLGSYTRGSLGARETRKVQQHLASCAACSIVGEEARDVGSRLTLVLLPLAAGIAGAAAYTVSMQGGGGAAVSAAASAASALHAGPGAAAHAVWGAHAGSGASVSAGSGTSVSASTGAPAGLATHAAASPASMSAGSPTVAPPRTPASVSSPHSPSHHAGALRPVAPRGNGVVGAARRGLVSVFPRARTAVGFAVATAAAVGAAFLLSPMLTSTTPSSVEAGSSSSIPDALTAPATAGQGAAASLSTAARSRQNGSLLPVVRTPETDAGARSNAGASAESGSRSSGASTRDRSAAEANLPAAGPSGTSGTADPSPSAAPETTPTAEPTPPPTESTTPPTTPPTTAPPTPTPTPEPTAPPQPPAVPPAPEAEVTPDPDGHLYPIATGHALPGATVEIVDLSQTTTTASAASSGADRRTAVTANPANQIGGGADDSGSRSGSGGGVGAGGSPSAIPMSSDTSVPAGVVVAETRADGHGAFTVSDFDGLTFGEHRLAVRQIGEGGVRSPVSVETSIVLFPIALISPQRGTELNGAHYIVDARGDADAVFEQLLDGRPDPRAFTLNADGNFSGEFTAPTTPGTATIAIRYADPDTGRHGPSATAQVTFRR